MIQAMKASDRRVEMVRTVPTRALRWTMNQTMPTPRMARI